MVSLRPTHALEARAAVLAAVMTAVFGAPPELVTGWLSRRRLREEATTAEWFFLEGERAAADVYTLHIEAIWALAWVLGVAPELDPAHYCGDGLALWLPQIGEDEAFQAWRYRNGVQLREPAEVAALLDLYYCLDWVHARALDDGVVIPGAVQPYVIGQRRWALEWSLVFQGPFHAPPVAWDQIDLG
jgi:hypothetical protein